jgi:hypothetical protein
MMNHIWIVLFGVLVSVSAQAHDWESSRPDAHAPRGVMGDHVHQKGEWMFSYRYMVMGMDGNREGTSTVSEADVLTRFMVTPLQMTMQMHMVGAMFAPSDWVTLMAMLPYVVMEMDHRTRMGIAFTTKTQGLGDVKLTALVPLYALEGNRIHAHVGLNFPTGGIDETGDTPMGTNQQLPYPMQLGSGTFDARFGLTGAGQMASWSYGAQIHALIRVGDNDRDYTLGNQLGADVWAAYLLANRVSISGRVAANSWGNVDGADVALNPMMVPTANSNLRGGKRIDGLVGINVLLPSSHRLAMEVGMPVYQSLDGPQLEVDFHMTLGWQYRF